jgi:hypothetical protein
MVKPNAPLILRKEGLTFGLDNKFPFPFLVFSSVILHSGFCIALFVEKEEPGKPCFALLEHSDGQSLYYCILSPYLNR